MNNIKSFEINNSEPKFIGDFSLEEKDSLERAFKIIDFAFKKNKTALPFTFKADKEEDIVKVYYNCFKLTEVKLEDFFSNWIDWFIKQVDHDRLYLHDLLQSVSNEVSVTLDIK